MTTSVTMTAPNRRILLVDDNEGVHPYFTEVLAPEDSAAEMDAAAANLFGESEARVDIRFELSSAYQGEEALEMVRSAREAGRPFAMAFVDMRMPPGWDGLTTIVKIWEVDPEIQIVICTAYSDHTWAEIQAALTDAARWLVLKKPFDKIEVVQLAHALTEKWNLARRASLKFEALERLVEARTLDLQHAHRVKNEFLASVSHELLTPMNGLCGFNDMLADTPLNEEQQEFVEEAGRCGRNLLKLIEGVLDFNRSEAGTLVIQPVGFRPGEFLESVVADHAAAALAKGIELRADCSRLADMSWIAPTDLIRKVLNPLIENAVKFTAQGSVTLAVEAHERGLRFSVTDTGVGLTPQQLEWIQIPFAQVDGGTTRRNTGIGLGLPLARQLVRAMGGELKLTGEPDRGVTARFTLKASPQLASAAA